MELKEYENLFKLHYAELCAYANKYMEDVDAAEEIVQSLFVKLWESKDELRIEKSKRSYLYTAVRNACFNQFRHLKVKEEYKRNNEREMEESQYTVHDEFSASELDVKIRKSIESLPEGRKRIFLMSRFEGLKYKEIAEKLKISVKTVENQMGSAIKYLKNELAEYVTLVLLLILIG